MNVLLERFELPAGLRSLLDNSPSVIIPDTKDMLYELIFGSDSVDQIAVSYDVGGEVKTEAVVARCKNGAVVNFTEDYMRRRDPDCMRIADGEPTDKPRFEEVYGRPFDEVEQATYDWLARQELILVPFMAGGAEYGYPALRVCPRNAAFFAFALAQLQAFVNAKSVEAFRPRAVIYVAPPFRHTHFNGRQVCVHRRLPDRHEIFAYNLYPGPSAKKGIYSVLLDIGEREGWVTAHASAARIISP